MERLVRDKTSFFDDVAAGRRRAGAGAMAPAADGGPAVDSGDADGRCGPRQPQIEVLAEAASRPGLAAEAEKLSSVRCGRWLAHISEDMARMACPALRWRLSEGQFLALHPLVGLEL